MSEDIPLHFRLKPDQHRLHKVLGPLEHDIMQIMWQQPSATVKIVHYYLTHTPEHTGIAYTTIMTTMRKLSEKGMLHRQYQGLAYVYTPTMDRHQFESMMVQRVLDSLLDDYEDNVVEYLTDYLVQHRTAHRA